APIAQVLNSGVRVDYWIDVDRSEAAKLTGLPFQASVAERGGFQVPGDALDGGLAKLQAKGAKVGAVRPLASVVEAYFLKAIGRPASFDPARGAA
ncbi:MAG TPA: hypothetical protein VFR02_09345, partial [bacterium]|nr:hypothetical protein [bacterium]